MYSFISFISFIGYLGYLGLYRRKNFYYIGKRIFKITKSPANRRDFYLQCSYIFIKEIFKFFGG